MIIRLENYQDNSDFSHHRIRRDRMYWISDGKYLRVVSIYKCSIHNSRLQHIPPPFAICIRLLCNICSGTKWCCHNRNLPHPQRFHFHIWFHQTLSSEHCVNNNQLLYSIPKIICSMNNQKNMTWD